MATRVFLKDYKGNPASDIDHKCVLQVRFRVSRPASLRWINALPDDYLKMKEELEKKVRENLIAMNIHPLKTLDFSTPKSYKKYGFSPIGSYFSFFVGPSGDSYPIPNKMKKLNNAYLATQWLLSPGGFGAATVEGKYAVQAILKDDKRKDISF